MKNYKKIDDYLNKDGILNESIKGCVIVMMCGTTDMGKKKFNEYIVKEFNPAKDVYTFYMKLFAVDTEVCEWHLVHTSWIEFVIEKEKDDKEMDNVELWRLFKEHKAKHPNIDWPQTPLRPMPYPVTMPMPVPPRPRMDIPYCCELNTMWREQS
jgi:hypothetical protein